MDISLHLVRKQWFLGTRIKTSLLLRFKWPCVYPSLYGNVPPVSTRIISHFQRVLTSFVPPIHNQGVSSCIKQFSVICKYIKLFNTVSCTQIFLNLKHPDILLPPNSNFTSRYDYCFIILYITDTLSLSNPAFL